jgi:hypothetical protein
LTDDRLFELAFVQALAKPAMIPEIGIMIGIFILARRIPAQWKLLSAGFGAAAFLVAVLAVADLGIRGFSDQTLVSLLPVPSAATASRGCGIPGAVSSASYTHFIRDDQ